MKDPENEVVVMGALGALSDVFHKLAGGRPVGYNYTSAADELKPKTAWDKSSLWSERDLNSGPPDFKSSALTNRPPASRNMAE